MTPSIRGRTTLVTILVVAMTATACSAFSVDDTGDATGRDVEITGTDFEDRLSDTVVVAEPGVQPTAEPTSAYSSNGGLSYEELTGSPEQWDPASIHLVEFVEEAVDHEFRHRFFIVEAPPETNPVPVFPDELAEAFGAIDDMHRALGTSDLEYNAAEGLFATSSLSSFNEGDRIIRVESGLDPVVADTALIGSLLTANQWGNRQTRATGSIDPNAGFMALAGERRFVQQLWLAQYGPEARQIWWDVFDGLWPLAPTTDEQLRDAEATIGAAFMEHQYSFGGPQGVAASFDRVPLATRLMFPTRISPESMSVSPPLVALPAGSSSVTPLMHVGPFDLLVAANSVVALSEAINATSEIGFTISRPSQDAAGRVCVGIGIGSWRGESFESAPAVFDAWAAALPEHRSALQISETELIISGCDPGVGNVPAPASIGSTAAAVALLTRLDSYGFAHGEPIGCSEDAVLEFAENVTLDDPLLRAPLDELGKLLPAVCSSS